MYTKNLWTCEASTKNITSNKLKEEPKTFEVFLKKHMHHYRNAQH